MSQTTKDATTTRPRALARKGAAMPVGQQAPTPPKRRRPALTALAVLLIVGGAALAGTLALRMDSREPVLAFAQDVPVGAQLTADMFTEADVASEGLRLVDVESLAEVEGLYLRQTAYEGQLLDTTMLTRNEPIGDDQAQVGIPLSTGKVPPGLRRGDAITLMRIGDQQAPGEVLGTGLVLEVDAGEEGGLGTAGSGSVATVLVARSAASDIVGAAGNDSLGVALLERGVSLEDAEIDAASGS